MSILINKNTRLLVQGITGNEGLFHTTQMVAYGTNVVAGVTPGKGGEWVLNGKIPIFDSVKLAVEATGANASVIFVPARAAPDAMFETADAGIVIVGGGIAGLAAARRLQRRGFTDFQLLELESRPGGNAVSLEEQMMKVAANQMDFQAATTLYRRSLGLIKTALGRGGG